MTRAKLTAGELETFRSNAIAWVIQMISKRGPQSFSMRALANELGVSPMTPYRYFTDKDHLLATVREEAFRHFADSQRAVYQATDPAHRLSALGRSYLQFAIDEPGLYRVMFDLEQAPSDTHPGLAKEQNRSFSYLLASMEEAIRANGRTGNALLLAHLAWATVHGIISLHFAGKLTIGCALEDLLQSSYFRIHEEFRSPVVGNHAHSTK
ncbi:MAG: TetR/AcrR family transcriptional regulator [Nannocystaceae bacterium]